MEETDFSRLNARINSDVFLTKTLTLATDVYFTNLNYTLQDDGVNKTTSPRYLALVKAPFWWDTAILTMVLIDEHAE